MTTITIPLSEERAAQLRLWAEEVGLPPEEFLLRRVEQLLDRPDEQFQKAAALGFSLVCNHLFVDGNKRIGPDKSRSPVGEAEDSRAASSSGPESGRPCATWHDAPL